MVKVKCPACDFEFEYNPQSPYCPRCGAVVPPPSQQSAQQPPSQQPGQQSTPQGAMTIPPRGVSTPQGAVSRYVIYAVRQDGSRERVTEVREGEPEVVLGRYELYNYALRDPDTISRVHVRFVVKGGKLYVRDDGSTNGTYVDGQDIRGKGEVELPPGKEALLVNPKVPTVRLVAEPA